MERQLSHMADTQCQVNRALIQVWSVATQGSWNRSAPVPVRVFIFTLLAHMRKAALCSRHSKYDSQFTVTSFKYDFLNITKV